MGLGAWLAVESDKKAYYVEEARERREVQECPEKEEKEIYEIFDQYHISRESSKGVVEALKVNPDVWVQVYINPSPSGDFARLTLLLQVHDGLRTQTRTTEQSQSMDQRGCDLSRILSRWFTAYDSLLRL